MQKLIAKISKFLNGKKTLIGASMHLAWFVANLAFKDLSSPTETATGHAIIGSITGVGIGHKIAKNKERISKTINNIKK